MPNSSNAASIHLVVAGLDPPIFLPTLSAMNNSSPGSKAPTYDDLFDLPSRQVEKVALASDAVVLRRFASEVEAELLAALNGVVAHAPFRNMVTPGGYTMSVAMTNCGAAGWVTDLTGYRYTRQDPLTGNPWPPMPAIFLSLARRRHRWLRKLFARCVSCQPLRTRHQAGLAPGQK
jgi:alkylated DNA repair dioxygenase AlkB